MTPNQQRIIIFLAGRVDARSREITEGLQMGLSTLQSCMPDLYDDDLVRKTKVGAAKVCRYYLTDDGMATATRLVRYQKYSAGPINCDRIKPMELPCYVPPALGYLRNAGHVNIASRGLM